MKAYLTVGVPGSGKTSYAKKLQKSHKVFVIEGDVIRSELFGDASVYGRWNEVWSKVDELVENNVGRDLVLDGTFETTDLRAEAISLLRSYGYEDIEAIVFNPSLATCLSRNWTRTRVVPDYIVKEKYERMQRDLPEIESEGFEQVTFV
jgi:predicted kinase